MEKQKKLTLLFVLSFPNMVGNYVRALCLKNFSPDNWEFIYLKGCYPKLFDFYIIRFIYRFFFYLYKIYIITFGKKNIVVYFIVPQNPLLLFILKNILRIKILVDINDALHLNQFLGYKKLLLVLKSSNGIIFESIENAELWKNKINIPLFIVEDTPQHECIYFDYLKRKKKLIWIGSFHTSIYLKNFYKYFKIFHENGYEIRILGGTKKISSELNQLKIKNSYLTEYNLNNLVEELTSSRISFVPMENNDLFNLRGNLKTKVSMGYGCLVIATNNAMHRRIIKNKKTGYLFNNEDELKKIISDLDNLIKSKKIAFEGNKYVANNFTRLSHAKKITEIAEKLINI